MTTWTCKVCGASATNVVFPVYCKCGTTHMDPTQPQTQDRALICHKCPYRVPKGCALYIRPCTVKQLWKDQIPPPEKCPNKDKFDE